MNDQNELESRVGKRLEEIRTVPPRNPQAAARGRAQFLGQAVSAGELRRHKGWISISRKERFAMTMIISILVIAGLLLGGGATVKAAQNDLPNEPLYALKMWSEDISLQFQNDPEQKVDRLMDLAQNRIQEMERLTDSNQTIPASIRQRLQDHIQQAMQICATMDDPVMDRTLLQLRDRLQQQDRSMEQIQRHATQKEDLTLLRSRTMLQQRLQLVDEGLINHEMFRNTVRNGFQLGQDVTATPPAQKGNEFKNGQPTLVPVGPNYNPGTPHMAPTASSYGPGEPNTDPGGPNMNATPSSTSGGNGTGGNGGGGTGSGGNGTGNNGPSGNGTGGMDTGGTGTGGGGGGGGNGSGNQGGRP